MKKSIRHQYTFIFAAIITVVLFTIWCVNNLFLEHFYIYDKKKILKESYVQIDEMIQANRENKIEVFSGTGSGTDPETPENAFLRELGETYNISIFIYDNATGGYLSTEPRTGRNIELQLKELYTDKGSINAGGSVKEDGTHKNNSEILEKSEAYTIQKVYNPRSKSYYLQSNGYLSDPQMFFLMSLPLSSIKESVALSNRFMTIISLAALVLGSIIVFITTKKVATPILELSKVSEQMCNLNFDAKYEGHSSDEIGILGNSMNALSDRLKETMGELKAANLKLQSDIEQKIRIDEMRKDFVSNVSHELKTPITIIHGYAEGLADGMCKNEESRNFYYQVILNESDKMTVLVRKLLNLSDLEFGFDPPLIEGFQLNDLLQDILAASDMLFKEKEATVDFTPSQPFFVYADEFKIEEVLHNYLSNALNHLEGGRLIQVRAEQQEDTVRVSVFNTGKTIPEKDILNIWSKFYKADKARTREYGGSGIGLSIVKAIMDSHHQKYGACNRENGVEFWFTLNTRPPEHPVS